MRNTFTKCICGVLNILMSEYKDILSSTTAVDYQSIIETITSEMLANGFENLYTDSKLVEAIRNVVNKENTEGYNSNAITSDLPAPIYDAFEESRMDDPPFPLELAICIYSMLITFDGTKYSDELKQSIREQYADWLKNEDVVYTAFKNEEIDMDDIEDSATRMTQEVTKLITKIFPSMYSERK